MSNDTNRPVIFFVRFKSALPLEEVLKRAADRLPAFRALPGLLQKYYVHDPVSGEFGGCYVWESRAALDEFLKSDLRKTIPDAYQIVGAPTIETMDIFTTLRP